METLFVKLLQTTTFGIVGNLLLVRWWEGGSGGFKGYSARSTRAANPVGQNFKNIKRLVLKILQNLFRDRNILSLY